MKTSHEVVVCRVKITAVLSIFVAACSLGSSREPGRPEVRTANVSPQPSGIEGAWRVIELAVRTPSADWDVRPQPQGGLYVFSARHYSYAYIPGGRPRPTFADPGRPTEAEKAAAYDTFIAGAGSYTFDGVTLELRADVRKNPNEMTGEGWRYQAQLSRDTLRLIFVNPPFLPGRDWRTMLVRSE